MKLPFAPLMIHLSVPIIPAISTPWWRFTPRMHCSCPTVRLPLEAGRPFASTTDQPSPPTGRLECLTLEFYRTALLGYPAKWDGRRGRAQLWGPGELSLGVGNFFRSRVR